MAFILCLFLLRNLVVTCTRGDYVCKAEELQPDLQRVISTTSTLSSTIIIYDKYSDHTNPILDSVVDYSRPLLLYEVGSFYSFLEGYIYDVLHNANLNDYQAYLNFLLICGKERLTDLMNHVNDVDSTTGQGSLLRHFSTWMIISPDYPPQLNTTLDHVSLIRVAYSVNETNLLYPTKRNMNKKRWCVLDIDVYTLLWKPGGRRWSRVHVPETRHDELHYALFPNKKGGLNGRQLRLSTLDWPPYAIRHKNGEKIEYTGAGIGGIDILGMKFNFSYVVVEPDDMLWGQEQVNGSWTGVTGMIQRAEADLCPAPYSINLKRKSILDFSVPFVSSDYVAVYRPRKDDTKSWLYFLSFFSWPVYLCGTVTLLWILFLLICINYIHHGTANSSCCLEMTFQFPLRQGIGKLPEESSARVVVFTWCMFCLVMTGVYTGNLVAFATVDKYRPPFTTLRELAEQDEYAVGVLEGTFAEQMLMNSTDPVLKVIYKKIIEARGATNTVNTFDDDIQKTLDEKYVLITVDNGIDILRSVTCDTFQLKERLNPTHSGYIYPRYSPLKKLFDEQIMHMRELGMFAKMRQDWTPKAKICDLPLIASKFKLNNLKTVFITCAGGILLSVLVLLLEIRKK